MNEKQLRAAFRKFDRQFCRERGYPPASEGGVRMTYFLQGAKMLAEHAIREGQQASRELRKKRREAAGGEGT